MADFQCSYCQHVCNTDTFQQCKSCSKWQTPHRITKKNLIKTTSLSKANNTKANSIEPQESEQASRFCECETPDIQEDGSCFACGLISQIKTTFKSNQIVNNTVKAIGGSKPAEKPIKTSQVQADLIQLSIDGQLSIPFAKGVILGRDAHQQEATFEHVLKQYPTVSRMHAWVGLINQNVCIVDLNSTNKTGIIRMDSNVEWLQSGSSYSVSIDKLPIQVGLGKEIVFTIQKANTL